MVVYIDNFAQEPISLNSSKYAHIMLIYPFSAVCDSQLSVRAWVLTGTKKPVHGPKTSSKG